MKLEGIILSSVDYKESSKIINLYTSLGKMGIKIPGGKNPKGAYLNASTPGLILDLIATDSKNKSLIEYHPINNPFDLVNDLSKINALMIILDILKKIPDENNHKSIYEFSKKIILSLNDNNPDKVLSIFLIKILYAYGVNPNLKSCVICNNKNVVSFSVSKGGALCDNCSTPDDTLNTFIEYYYDKKDIKDYSDTDFKILLDKIRNYYINFVPIKINF